MKQKNKKRGFTLVELIVVLLILAILAAVLTPSLMGYVKKAQNASLAAECRAVVVAAQGTVSDLYAKGTLSSDTLYDSLPNILALADGKGTILDLSYDLNIKVDPLIYKGKNGRYVLYENKIFTVYDTLPPAYSILGYLSTARELLGDALGMKPYPTWENLRKLFLEQLGGKNPGLSDFEKDLIAKVGKEILDRVEWKPTIVGNSKDPRDVVMVAVDPRQGPNMAYLVYYRGHFYYHCNGYNTDPQSTHLDDQGGFDPSKLTEKGPKGDYWIRID